MAPAKACSIKERCERELNGRISSPSPSPSPSPPSPLPSPPPSPPSSPPAACKPCRTMRRGACAGDRESNHGQPCEHSRRAYRAVPRHRCWSPAASAWSCRQPLRRPRVRHCVQSAARLYRCCGQSRRERRIATCRSARPPSQPCAHRCPMRPRRSPLHSRLTVRPAREGGRGGGSALSEATLRSSIVRQRSAAANEPEAHAGCTVPQQSAETGGAYNKRQPAIQDGIARTREAHGAVRSGERPLSTP